MPCFPRPRQFIRLCIEAEATAKAQGGSGCTVSAPDGAMPLDVLIGSHRIHGLIDSYMRDPFGVELPVRGASPPASPRK